MKTLISFDFKDLLRTCSKKETIIHRTTTKCIASLAEIFWFFALPHSTTYAFSLYAAFSFFFFYERIGICFFLFCFCFFYGPRLESVFLTQTLMIRSPVEKNQHSPATKKMERFTSLKQPSHLSSGDAQIVNQETERDFLHSGFLTTAGANYSHLRVSVCTCLPSFCLGGLQMSEEKEKKSPPVFSRLSVQGRLGEQDQCREQQEWG